MFSIAYVDYSLQSLSVGLHFTVWSCWRCQVLLLYGTCDLGLLQWVGEAIHLKDSKDFLPHVVSAPFYYRYYSFHRLFSWSSFLEVELLTPGVIIQILQIMYFSFFFLGFWYLSPRFHIERLQPWKRMRLLVSWALSTVHSTFIYILAQMTG